MKWFGFGIYFIRSIPSYDRFIRKNSFKNWILYFINSMQSLNKKSLILICFKVLYAFTIIRGQISTNCWSNNLVIISYLPLIDIFLLFGRHFARKCFILFTKEIQKFWNMKPISDSQFIISTSYHWFLYYMYFYEFGPNNQFIWSVTSYPYTWCKVACNTIKIFANHATIS